jgi:hypothetical protein
MKIKHPLHDSVPGALSIKNQTLSKGSPISVPLSEVSKEILAYEKAGIIRIVKKGNVAILVKLK